jgi:hypothetical protein
MMGEEIDSPISSSYFMTAILLDVAKEGTFFAAIPGAPAHIENKRF